MQLNVGRIYQDLIEEDTDIPLMASCSPSQIGALNAESFCERVISQGNLVMNDGNTLISDEELEMLVVLRINRKFMEFMRGHYNHLSRQQFSMSVIEDENDENESETDD
eukprot:Lithocolla_globosa_v1_NODE_6205_length_1122_cov_61.683224.p1 type:complete len:109 gc:universal NODE_6205_length_1122_cov_61.683224:885-559(-)